MLGLARIARWRGLEMISRAGIALAAFASAAALTTAARAATVITVPGTADIFAAGLGSPPSSVNGGGSPAAWDRRYSR